MLLIAQKEADFKYKLSMQDTNGLEWWKKIKITSKNRKKKNNLIADEVLKTMLSTPLKKKKAKKKPKKK